MRAEDQQMCLARQFDENVTRVAAHGPSFDGQARVHLLRQGDGHARNRLGPIPSRNCNQGTALQQCLLGGPTQRALGVNRAIYGDHDARGRESLAHTSSVAP